MTRQLRDGITWTFYAVPALALLALELACEWAAGRLADLARALNKAIDAHYVAFCAAVWFIVAATLWNAVAWVWARL
jgi:hypothetical protein